ncbi:MAG: ABC transporter substrate-binding protein [Pseudomonadota bacterium]
MYTRRLATLLLAFSLVACTPPPDPPLVVGVNTWPGYAPLWLASQPIEQIHMVQYPSTSDAMKDMRGGILDAAALTLDETLKLAGEGLDLHIVLPLDVSHGADGLIAKDPIRDLGGLRGKRIGVENTALGAYMLTRSLEKAGLGITDVAIVPLEIPDHPKAWAADEIDAAITFEPQLSQLKSAGGTVLLDTRDLPNEIIDVLVVRQPSVIRHATVMQELNAAWHRTIANLTSQPDLSLSAIASASGNDVEALEQAYRGLSFPDRDMAAAMLSGPKAPLCATLREMAMVMVRHGLLPTVPERLPAPCNQGSNAT